jgi:hypothetical protein
MFSDILPFVQGIAEQFMLDDIAITNRLPSDQDAENPFGDDTPEYVSSTIHVKGWLVDPATKSLQDDGGMSVVVSEPTLRVPVGTLITRGAKVVAKGLEYKVIGDSSEMDTWPAMLKVRLAKSE